MEDIDIARSIAKDNIEEIAKKYGIERDDLELYGKYKAKISRNYIEKTKSNKDGKLILVTAINPTPLGEGKTTISIGLSDGLNRIGKKSVLALREPSVGPVFGIKGGATGGGYAQIVPMEDINLHFTGDIHAITAANNLLSAMIDNHIYNGNALGFKKVVWKRCLDLNDRALRDVRIALTEDKKMVPRDDHFDISVASEIMAIFCLAEDLKDLKRRLGNIIIGFNEKDEPIYARDLKADGSMAVLLKDAINPNIVQTLEHNLAIVHGGPFANIAHGCNSIIATRLALKLGDYAVTEAGFGADLGAEKFLDIKERKLMRKPDVVVVVATLKALKYHGGASIKECTEENLDYLEKGLPNLFKHIDNMNNIYNTKVIVAINKYANDSEKEIKFLEEKLKEKGSDLSLCDVWAKGGEGALDLAEKVVKTCGESKETKPTFAYDDSDSLEEKLRKVSQKVYGAKDIELSDEAKEQLKEFERLGYGKYPVCIAKTQYSLSDDPKNLLCEDDYIIHVRELQVRTGAEFVVAITGKIFTMPGLPKVPAAEKIDLDDDGNIVGLF